MSGCGCGQGGGHGCGCGRAAAAGVVRDGAFTRPSFFDGQLLCADDLQALAAYMRGKHRLHNRYLVGEGVVCGLEVVCSRAGEGSVLVRAGYALDCCGNDIVVACDQTVDINQLVAALPHDAKCADPCPPPATDDEDDEDARKEQGEQGGTVPRPLPRRYELVVEYAETPGDLVAPYSTGEESARACEPTRFQEGYRFSLRCGTDREDAACDLVAALACCDDVRGRLEALEKAAEVARELATAGEGPLPEAPTAAEFETARQRLRAAAELHRAVEVAGMAVRLAAAGQAELAREALDDVRDALGPIRQSASEAVARDPLGPAQAGALGDLVASLAGRLDQPQPTRLDRLLAAGVVAGGQVSESLRSLVLEGRDWALCWLEQHPGGRCRSLERSLTRLVVPDDDRPEELRKAAREVADALRRILLDCVCAAVNPPCAPCDDTAVVLAEVAVDRCEVVEICSLVRRHAVTGAALRYWLPFDWAERRLEEACCGDADVDPGKLLDLLHKPVRALGDSFDRRELRTAAIGAAPAPPEPPAAPAEPLTQSQQRLLTMLNSQVQSMQAKLRKLERAAGGEANG
jgi:hypothetical protein